MRRTRKNPNCANLTNVRPKARSNHFWNGHYFCVLSVWVCGITHMCTLNIFKWDIHIRMRAGNHLNTNKPFNFQPFKRSEIIDELKEMCNHSFGELFRCHLNAHSDNARQFLNSNRLNKLTKLVAAPAFYQH